MSKSSILKSKNNLTRYCFKISYNGSKFNGWAIQTNYKTIQGDLQNVLFDLYKQKIIVYGSGRTDSGVHAIEQVFHFDAPSYISIKGILSKLNNYNKGLWHVFGGKILNTPFHARFNVKNKTYLYKIKLVNVVDPLSYDFFWQILENISLKKLRDITKLFKGEHDFLSFTTEYSKNSIKKINDIKISKQKNLIQIKINGSGFLRHMVRMIVGCMVSFASGKITFDDCLELFKNPKKGSAIFKAPSSGLYLLKVIY
ncbi:tRNA pseudouridine(38-40) synthase TruA [Mycoplasmoides alvi]|uniref:tRNA pseudouridine(38-40) synthase TruA n=1 Tax=Mycoplasmoides alvi TaxID=78580 RepID=UPI000698A254|nr:tRNA pseudouridine(38-40) synthase TruA [Mycoplasmoides alvi]